jgi:hypothetical protein
VANPSRPTCDYTSFYLHEYECPVVRCVQAQRVRNILNPTTLAANQTRCMNDKDVCSPLSRPSPGPPLDTCRSLTRLRRPEGFGLVVQCFPGTAVTYIRNRSAITLSLSHTHTHAHTRPPTLVSWCIVALLLYVTAYVPGRCAAACSGFCDPILPIGRIR